MKRCPKCGMLNEVNALQCKSCSYKFKEKSPTWDDVMQSDDQFDYLFVNKEIDSISLRKEVTEKPEVDVSTTNITKTPEVEEQVPVLDNKTNTTSIPQKKQKHTFRSILIFAIALVISYGIYTIVMVNTNTTQTGPITKSENPIKNIVYDAMGKDPDKAALIVGSWKYYIFPGQCDATKYLTFRSDGTFEMYENPGVAYATHCQGKESGTYTFDGKNLTLNYLDANWPYTVNWVDDNNFECTYVSDVNTYTRVADEEYNMYLE